MGKIIVKDVFGIKDGTYDLDGLKATLLDEDDGLIERYLDSHQKIEDFTDYDVEQVKEGRDKIQSDTDKKIVFSEKVENKIQKIVQNVVDEYVEDYSEEMFGQVLKFEKVVNFLIYKGQLRNYDVTVPNNVTVEVLSTGALSCVRNRRAQEVELLYSEMIFAIVVDYKYIFNQKGFKKELDSKDLTIVLRLFDVIVSTRLFL